MRQTGEGPILLAGFRVERLLGSGGMGEVYLVHHPRLPRLDALKVLPPAASADHSYRERFQREADLAAQLDHDNVVTVYDRGEADGQLWIHMKYVEGQDAAAALRGGGPLSAQRALHVVTKVAAALDDAHRHDLLHRDVKPANILLGRPSAPGEPERVYLSDFGIAKGVGDAAGLTPSGHFAASLDYAAPEQIQVQPLDGRADQYALGCVLFQLLTGSVPFRGDGAWARMNAHLTEPVPKVGLLRPGLPPAVQSVLDRAMAKRPGDRFASCGGLARAFGDALHGMAPEAVLPAPRQADASDREPDPVPERIVDLTEPPTEALAESRPVPADDSPAQGPLLRPRGDLVAPRGSGRRRSTAGGRRHAGCLRLPAEQPAGLCAVPGGNPNRPLRRRPAPRARAAARRRGAAVHPGPDIATGRCWPASWPGSRFSASSTACGRTHSRAPVRQAVQETGTAPSPRAALAVMVLAVAGIGIYRVPPRPRPRPGPHLLLAALLASSAVVLAAVAVAVGPALRDSRLNGLVYGIPLAPTVGAGLLLAGAALSRRVPMLAAGVTAAVATMIALITAPVPLHYPIAVAGQVLLLAAAAVLVVGARRLPLPGSPIASARPGDESVDPAALPPAHGSAAPLTGITRQRWRTRSRVALTADQATPIVPAATIPTPT